MADRDDIVTVTLTRYKERGWCHVVWWRDKHRVAKIVTRSPIAVRWMGKGRKSIDFYGGWSIIIEFWSVR